MYGKPLLKTLLLMLILLPLHIFKAEELSDASISIICSNENETQVPSVEIDLYDSNNKLIDSQISNNEGVVEFKDVSLGTYIVAISGIPIEYQDFETEYQVNVTNANQHYFINNKLFLKSYNTIKFYKMDSKRNPLSGSELTIYDESDNVVEVLVTDKNGFAESNPLENGYYYIQETKAAAGYELDTTRYKIYVGSGVSSLEYTSVSDPIMTKSAKTNEASATEKKIEILNQSGDLLAGVKFELIDSNAQQLKLKSNENGILYLPQLSSGNYTLKLVDNNFISETPVYNFSVSNTGGVSSLPSQIYLSPTGGISIPKLATTGVGNYKLMSLFVALLLAVVNKFSIKG